MDPDKGTMLMKQNLIHLAKVYDLRPFLFTKKIHILPGSQNQSHPVLTLNTRNAEFPSRILADFLYGQLFWWIALNPENSSAATFELKKVYPRVPFTSSPEETYKDLIVCYLQLKALQFYLGNKEAGELITKTMKKQKSLGWVYYQILYKDFAIKKVILKFNLLPVPLV